MATQLLFYERVTPVSLQRHSNWSVESANHYEFARRVNSVPLVAAEMPHAVSEYTIVFAGTDEALMPVVLLGVEGNDNLYVTDSGGWDAKYVPAFVRRYPFVFSKSEDGATFTPCIDESWSGCNEDGRGQRLFNEQGERTPYLDNILSFLQEYQTQFVRTQAYCQKLKELALLESTQAQLTLATGEQRSLVGFMAVNRDKLKALPGEKLAELAKTDELELTYTHLQSMNNFSLMLERATERRGQRTITPGPEQGGRQAAEETSLNGAAKQSSSAAPKKANSQKGSKVAKPPARSP